MSTVTIINSTYCKVVGIKINKKYSNSQTLNIKGKQKQKSNTFQALLKISHAISSLYFTTLK